MVSYEDKELKLLVETVDNADKRYATKMTPKTMQIIKVVENFISDNDNTRGFQFLPPQLYKNNLKPGVQMC